MEKLPKELEEILEPGEKVGAAAKDFGPMRPTFVVVTDRRVIIFRRGLVAGGAQEFFPFDKISHVGMKRGIMSDELTINMGGHITKISNLDHKKENNPKLVFDLINEKLQKPAAAAGGFCPFCGAQLVPGATFCRCGYKKAGKK